ncbi:hypothetical protein VTJ83DRAFT_2178 [Remersonia thermophila]|uniref:Uncharacterized protein n=1 Tax=Remersonia thermophila TaxID=72144 RepID=A0ABR4DI53_9PEZI
MGATVSTLVGWTVVIGCIYLVVLGIPGQRKGQNAVRGPQRNRIEEKKEITTRKEPKEKAKRPKAEPKPRDAEASQPKSKPSKPAAVTSHAVDTSSEDDVDNREFARQLANVKQGTSLNGPKKSDEKRQKSVKQSRAQILSDNDDDDKANRPKSSAPSSTAGVDADDDTSAAASPEVKAADASGVADMLEPKAAGPSVLRLTDTDKAKQKKQKKAKEPEKTETKKQRQNRQKAEAAKALREENEKQRKADLEAQRRQARIAEGRPAKDGSAFLAQQKQQSAWTAGANPANGSPSTNGDVQPLDTFSTGSYTDVSVPKEKEGSSPAAKQPNPANSWIATLPSEEEQMEMLRNEEESWSTVTSKKPKKKAAKEAAAAATVSGAEDSEPTPATKPAPAAKAAPAPAPVSTNTLPTAAPKRTGSTGAFKSSFAALSANEPEEEENEWDV